jgi:hypothetical protein
VKTLDSATFLKQSMAVVASPASWSAELITSKPTQAETKALEDVGQLSLGPELGAAATPESQAVRQPDGGLPAASDASPTVAVEVHASNQPVSRPEGSDTAAAMEVAAPSSCASGACGASGKPYLPLHPELFRSRFDHAWLAPSLAAALADGSESALRSILAEEVPGRVFSFEMLQPSFCAQLLAECEQYEASGHPIHRPNSMNNYGIILNQIGMRPLLDDLQARAVLPLTRMLFPTQGARFSAHHSFLVKYRQGEDLGLDM